MPGLDVRINSLMTTREDVLDRMSKIGIEAEVTKWSPEGLTVARKGFDAALW